MDTKKTEHVQINEPIDFYAEYANAYVPSVSVHFNYFDWIWKELISANCIKL